MVGPVPLAPTWIPARLPVKEEARKAIPWNYLLRVVVASVFADQCTRQSKTSGP